MSRNRRIHRDKLLFFLSFLLCSTSAVCQAQDEAQVLLELKSQFVDPEGRLSWNMSSGMSVCGWLGIDCNNGSQVTSITLPRLSLQGSISPAIGRLTSLRSLDLSENNLTGPIPEAIINCTSLSDLNLGENNLTGSIPVQLGQVANLEFLRLHQNRLQGQIPASIGFMKNLRKLRLDGNQLTGSIPKEIGNCSSLGFLQLYENLLEGEIPPELGNLRRLSHLSLYQNRLSGTIPKELANCRSLQRVDLYNNKFEGELFGEIGSLVNLKSFQASNCGLRGSLPPGLGNITGLQTLDLSMNQLSGPLPETLGREWKQLTNLNMSRNSINGGVPVSFGDMVDLSQLDLSFNNFTETLPSSLGLLTSLSKLLISSNSLQGELPPALGNSSRLSEFNASDNNFSGTLPSGLCAKGSLTVVSISNNRLNGTLAGLLGNCGSLVTLKASTNRFSSSLESFASPALMRLDISSNQIQGRIPEQIKELTQLQYLLLSHNSFEGELPDLSTLSQLRTLDVSFNALTGSIPSNLGTNLQMLETINFSNNNFSGGIPQSMSNLRDLQSFNFSNNNLDGTIPQIKAFTGGPASAFFNNPGLCGPPLGDCSPGPGSPGSPPRSSRRRGRKSAGRTVGLVFIILGGLVLCAGATFLFCTHKELNRRKSAKVQENRFADKVPTMYAEAEKATEGFSEANVIGVGPNGTVYKAIYAWEKILAVKVLHTDPENDERHYYFNAAARKLSRIRHPNVVRLEGFIIYGGKRIFLYEYMPNKSLGEVLHAPVGPKLHWNSRYKIALGAAQGLSHLHHQGSIIHCDIKSNNIMLDSAFGAHIGDIGVAKLVKDPRNLAAVDRTLGYAAPEAMRVSLRADVYSFGVVLLELLTGRTPLVEDGSSLVTWVRNSIAGEQPLSDIVDPILRNVNGPFQEEISALCKVALACTDSAPNRRPTMKEVVDVLTRIRQEPGGPKLRSLRSFIHRRSFVLLSTSEREMDEP